jgi:signal transduction histidine kinase/ActR/RegA family two-component response regulator
MSAEWQVIVTLNDQLRPLRDPVAIQEAAVRLIGQHLHASRVNYSYIQGDDFVAGGSYTDGLPPVVGRVALARLSPSVVDACRRGETVVVNDIGTDERFAEIDRQRIRTIFGIAAFIGVPLIKEGQWLAQFGVHSATPRLWTDDQIALVKVAAERTWVEAELRANEERLGFLLRLNDALRPLRDPLAVQQTAARLLGEHLGAGRVGYAEIDGDEYVLRCEYTRGLRPLAGRGSVAVADAALRDAYNRGETVVVADVASDSRFSDAERALLAGRQIAAYVGVRLIKGGRPVAAFAAHHPTPRMWTATEVTLVRDVAERTWEAAERAHAEIAMREHEARFHRVLSAAGAGCWTWDMRTTEAHWDDTLRARFDFAPGERPWLEKFLSRVHPDDRPRAQAQFEEILRTLDNWENSYRFVFPDGTVRWMQSLGHADRDATGQVIRLTGFELDIDEQRTKQLSQMAWDLTLAEHRAREQIAKTLHDGLQQLLVIVALNLDVQLKRDTESGRATNPLLAEAKRHIDEAIAAARSLNRVLIPPVLHRSGLPAALTWLADWTRDKYKLDVEIAADPLADSARSDLRTLIYESARELLFNAVKHAQTGRVSLELTIDADDQLCVTVTDEGVGFEPASLDDRWKTSQVGWGLFSIRERMTLLGGRFDLDSSPGRGTRVRLVVPRGAPAAADGVPAVVPPQLAAANAVADTRRSHALRILLVDDHAAVRNALRQMLDERQQLHVVGEASDGVEAIVQARELRPDVILMDVMMPQMDGIEATQRIHAELPDIQILGLSMQARSDTVHAIEKAGAAGFFVKGLDTQRLLDRLLSLHDAHAVALP